MDTSGAGETTVPRPRTLRVGLLLILAGSYLFFLPVVVWPFAEPKLLALTVGATLVWLSGLPLTRRPGFAAGVLAGVLVLAALAGVAPLDSLLGVRFASTGLVLLLPCLFLVAALPSLPEDTLQRLPAWLAALGLTMSAVMLTVFLLPRVLLAWTDLHATLTGVGFASTAGHPLYAVVLLAVAMAAALARLRRGLASRLIALGGVAVGLALPHETSSYLLGAIVIACWLLKARPPKAIAIQGLGVVALAFALSFALRALPVSAAPVAPADQTDAAGLATRAPTTIPTQPLSAAERRFTAWRVGFRAAAQRPFLGWGTDMGLSGFMANVTPQEAASLAPERSWWDVHNIFIQFLLTTGIVGLLALLFLATETVPRALTAPPELSWASVGVVTLGCFFLYEPISVAVLPVLAVLLGAVSRPRGTPKVAPKPRTFVGVVLVICTALATLALAQSATLLWSSEHQSRSALGASAAMVPWRVEPRWWIARISDPATASQIMARLVRDHRWDTEVRLYAAWVAELTGRSSLAHYYLTEQLKLFPGDELWVEAVSKGDWPP